MSLDKFIERAANVDSAIEDIVVEKDKWLKVIQALKEAKELIIIQQEMVDHVSSKLKIQTETFGHDWVEKWNREFKEENNQ